MIHGGQAFDGSTGEASRRIGGKLWFGFLPATFLNLKVDGFIILPSKKWWVWHHFLKLPERQEGSSWSLLWQGGGIVFEATQFVCLWRNHLLWCDFFRLKLIEWEKWHLAKGEFSLGDLTFWTDTLIPDPLHLNLAWFVWLLRQARKETVSKGYLIGEAEFLAGVILVFSTPSPVVSTISKIFTLGAPSEEYKFFIKKFQGGSNQLWIRNWMWMWGGSLWGSISVWEPGFGMWGQRRGRENFG